MRTQIRTCRQKVGDYWVAIFYEKLKENVWHVGININKSKRAQVDWYKKEKTEERVGQT